MSNGDYYDPSWTILEQAVEYARTTLKIDLTQYDSNQDSVIDGVWLVYSFKENDSNVPGNVAWAYTYCDYSKESAYFNSKYLASPVGYHYCWASYNFAVSATGYGYNSAKPDVHTYAHETGHLMGLNDYYNTSDSDDCNNAGVSEVLEGVADGNIMMDCNIGDHDAFSKFSLNWVSPYVIDGTAATTTISIKPFEENGDCILLRNTSSDPWNGKVFDEYLLIDYYTPSNLQQKDTIGYDNGYNTYNSSGIRVYHVDSRLINEHTSNGKETYSYVDTYESSDENDYAFIAAGNSQVGSVDQTGSKLSKARQLSLIDASNKSTYSGTSFDSSYGNDNVLFQVGDTFSMSKYAKYFKVNSGKFNDGTTLGYTFKIDDLGDEATLTFTKA
jgi:M6 family metalloprotease-like protein